MTDNPFISHQEIHHTDLSSGQSGVRPATYAGPPVDPNIASEAELAALPGIGATQAQLVVSLRQEINGFTSFEQFCGLLGLNPDISQSLQPFLILPHQPEPSRPLPTRSSTVSPESVSPSSPAPYFSGPSHAASQAQGPIDPNNDSASGLLRLPGLTADDAQRLIAERERRFGFDTLEEVLQFLNIPANQQADYREQIVLNPYQSPDNTVQSSAHYRLID